MTRILLLSRYGRLGASSRVRSYQYLDYLRAHGFEVIVAPLFDDDYVRGLYAGAIPIGRVLGGYLRRLRHLAESRRFDLVWVEKEALPWLPAWIELGALPRRIRLVADYDDAVFHRYDRHRLGFVRTTLGRKVDSVMARADVVIAGNPYLADRARAAGARRVELLPTVVDARRYTVSPATVSTPPVIGWIGSPSTARFLRQLVPVLRALDSAGDARFVAVGANPDQLAGVPIDVQPWSEPSEVERIQGFDIGIMPLPDEPFERGKCGYKLVQYMACGKPVVGSPVGVNSVIVRDGVEGFLPRDERGWIDSLRRLCVEPALRDAMGRAGRRRVEETYCLAVAAPRLESILRSALR